MAGGGGNAQPSTTTTTVQGPPGQVAAQNTLFQGAQQALQAGELGQVAPFTANQQQAFQQILDFANSPAGQQIPQGAMDALLSGLNLSQDPTQSPFIQNVVDAAVRPLGQQFSQNIVPSIGDAGISSGQFGNAQQGIATGIAGQELLAKTGDVSQNIFQTALTSGLNILPQLLGLSPTVQGLQTQPSELIGQVGAAQQAQAQAEISQTQNALQAFQGLINTNAGGTQTQTGPGAQGPSAFAAAAGGAMTGFAVTGSPYGAAVGALIGLFGAS